MLAFHNDPRIKAKYLRRVRAHAKADEIIKGRYWENGKGCAVGCTIHSGDHGVYPDELGIPAELAHLEDFFFERLPSADAKQWPLRFLKAARTGADLSRVYDLWSAWNLDDSEYGVLRLVSEKFPEVRKVVSETADACRTGTRVNAARAAEAARAAGAAEAARAAGAARAAEAARAAGAARAAWEAEAARAARAAWEARAAEAAWEAYIKAGSDKLIKLMDAA